MTDQAERVRVLWTEAVETEVEKRMRAYFTEQWMILRVDRRCIPAGATMVECYETEKEWIIIGRPNPEDETHDCDANGCSTISHVVARLQRPT